MIERQMQADGHSTGGYVIYRTTYSSEDDWAESLRRLRWRPRWCLGRTGNHTTHWLGYIDIKTHGTRRVEGQIAEIRIAFELRLKVNLRLAYTSRVGKVAI